jgi:uncharacterized protein YndB with AHSA1/START domain
MHKVETTININCIPEKIIDAFTELNMLHDWWGVERALIEKRIGGVYTLAWGITEKGFGYVSSGTIKNYEPGKILEITNLVYLNPEHPILGPMNLTIKTIQKENSTELYLCQDGYRYGDDWNWYYEAVTQAWPVVLETLKNYLEENKSLE